MIQRITLALVLGVVAWVCITAALFSMWGSVFVGLCSILAAVLLRERPGRLVAASLAVTPILLVQVALPEFAAGLDEISCRVRAAHGTLPPRCEPTAVNPGQTGPLLTSQQHLAIRWLNLHMAVGGWMVGFEEVAWETMQLDLQSTAEHRHALQAEPIGDRVRMCRDGAAKAGPLLERDSDFAMDAKLTSWTAAKLAGSTRDGQHRWKDLSFSEGYGRHPWHVALALLVPDSRLHAKRDGDTLNMWWAGSIQYPMHVIYTARLPRLVGSSYQLTLDEAAFCGLQMDGVWRPYRLVWRWKLQHDDPRIEHPKNDRRLFELILRGGSPDFVGG